MAQGGLGVRSQSRKDSGPVVIVELDFPRITTPRFCERTFARALLPLGTMWNRRAKLYRRTNRGTWRAHPHGRHRRRLHRMGLPVTGVGNAAYTGDLDASVT